jgi:hypothetical protein
MRRFGGYGKEKSVNEKLIPRFAQKNPAVAGRQPARAKRLTST